MLAQKLPGSRVIEGHVTTIKFGLSALKDRGISAKYLCEFVEEVKASGFVAQSLENNGVKGVIVAPKGSCN